MANPKTIGLWDIYSEGLLISHCGRILKETELAIKLNFWSEEYGDIGGWFPKSQIAMLENTSLREIRIPVWLIRKNMLGPVVQKQKRRLM